MTATTVSSSFLSTELAISLATFGIVSTVVTAMMKRRDDDTTIKQKLKSNTNTTNSNYPYHPPSRLVRYLKEKRGKKWEHFDEGDETFVRECPKVELHVHLDGSLDPDFLWQCLQAYDDCGKGWIGCLPVSTTLPWDPNNPLPVQKLVKSCKTVEDFHELCTCRRGTRSLQHMLTCFEIFLPLIREAPPPALVLLEELAYDFCRRQWEQNCIYTEVRYCPHLLMQEEEEGGETNKGDKKKGSFDMGNNDGEDATKNDNPPRRKQSAHDVVQAITNGLRRGCADFDIIVNQILCAINWRPDWAWDILELCQEFREEHPCGVVGIDIAAGEEHFDPVAFPQLHQPHFDMIQKAQILGVPVTIHAGETPNGGIDHVRWAVATHQDPDRPGYGAKRIGHGYRMADSVELMQQLAKDKIHIEICPTSSVETGGWIFDSEATTKAGSPTPNAEGNRTGQKKPWKNHPGLEMLRYGVPISLNSDDPSVFHTSLTWQYRIALVKMGLTREQLVKTNIHANEASFGRAEEKAKVERKLRSYRYAEEKASNRTTVTDQRFTDRVRDPF